MADLYDLDDVMDRLVAMEQEAIPGDIDAAKYWPYQQEGLPYWVNRVLSMEVEPDYEGRVIDRYTFGLMLVVGHLTQGVKAEIHEDSYAKIGQVLDFFGKRARLTSTEYPDEPDYLAVDEGGAVITGVPNGTRAVANTGIGVTQIVIEFRLQAGFYRQTKS